MLSKNYCLTSTCPTLKGFNRAAIYDLPKSTYEFVPNSIYDFLNLLSQNSITQIYNDTPVEYRGIVEEYLNYCLEKEYVLEIPSEINKKSFPKLSLEFEFPSIISNISVRINYNSTVDFEKIKTILIATKCYNIQLIFSKGFDLKNVVSYLDVIKDIGMSSMEIIIAYSADFDYEILTNSYKNISFVFIYSAPSGQFMKSHVLGLQQIFTSEKPFEITHTKSLDFFNVNITLFTESQKHNTYFNRKLFIDVNGDIKNAPLMENIFGNINSFNNSAEILKIIASNEFQEYWNVHKGLIDICKECEFRHMCVDNRIPVKRNEKEWYHEIECNYNPYIAKWQDEEGYKALKECGVQSNEQGLMINRKKLNAVNKEIWGDD